MCGKTAETVSQANIETLDQNRSKMQSSPPERAWQKPTSPAGSQYSLDLAALDLESRSGASSPTHEQHIDRVRSSDIEGPSDFTEHMEGWFRGGTIGKGTTRSRKQELESVRETRDEGVQANGSFLTPRKLQDEEQSASHHTPSNSPPYESVFDMRNKLGRSGHDLSEWDPYADGDESTPEPPTQKNFLQPTVEDYYSELTPARLPSVKRMKSTSSHTHVAGEELLREEDKPSSPGRPSSETLSPVRSPARSPERSPALHRTCSRQFSSQSTEAEFENQMQDLQAKCKQLELLNKALGQAADEERRMRADEKRANSQRAADAERQERALSEMKEQAYMQRDDYRNDLTELKSKLAQHERERVEQGRSVERTRQQYIDDTRKMSEDAQREKSQHHAALRALEQDLELARRSRDEAEESERALRAELDRQNAAAMKQDDDDLDRMQSDLTQIEDPEDRIRDLEQELQEARTEIEKLARLKRETQDELSDARAQLVGYQQSQDEETARITADHRRSTAVTEDLQAQLKQVREQLHSEQVSHKAEIERLRENKQTLVRTPSSDPEALRADLEAKQTELNTAILERDALRDDLEAQQSTLNAAILERDDAQDSLASLQSSLQEAKDALADQEAVTTALDTKVSAAIAKREAYWRGRLEASEKERKVMVKALLRQWGREEVGIVDDVDELDQKQGYEYRFVTRKGPRSNGVDAKAGA